MTSKTHFLEKKKTADTHIKRYTLIAAGTGFIPIPLLDAVAMSAVQYTLVRRLASLYEIPFKGHRVKAIGAAFMGSVGTISGFKFIPKIGTVLGGLSSSTIGAASTYAIGQVFMQHFDQGGTLLDFNPLTSRVHFEQELEKGKAVVAQLKEEATLNTESGQQKAIQQLKADSDEYLVLLAEMQIALEQYKKELAEPSLAATIIAPSVVEKSNSSLEEVQIEKELAESSLAATTIAPPVVEKNNTPLEEVQIEKELQVAVPALEKSTWWQRLKQRLKWKKELQVAVPTFEKSTWWQRLKQRLK